MEYLDLNTSAGGSLSEHMSWNGVCVLIALSTGSHTNEEEVEGYI